MRLFRRLTHWLRFRKNSADLAEEVAYHRVSIERDLISRGHSPAEARDAARRAMGNETNMREDARAVWLWPRLEAVLQDAKITLRGLRRSPAYAAGVMLTFALGVGANAAMFSLIDRMMLRPPEMMRDPGTVHRVYLFRRINGVEGPTGGQYARHADIARFTTSFSALAIHGNRRLAVGVGEDAREMQIGVVSANFFDFFDAPPAAGRYFNASEDSAAELAPVAVLSHAMWQSRYGGHGDVIGKTLQIGAVVYTIVGVAPKGFVGLWPLRSPVAFIPVSTHAASAMGPSWETTFTSAIGLGSIVRRKPGVSVDAATADIDRAFVQSYRQELEARGAPVEIRLGELRPRGLAASVLLERGPVRSNLARVATWLGGVAIIVLLIACANVASLLLTRALSRRREIAVRLALGVSRSRLVTQLLTESMVLAVAGSVLGVVVSISMGAMLTAAFLPGVDPLNPATDVRTLAFIGIVTIAVGAFTGILPVLQARRLALADDLRSGARAGTQHRSRTRSVLLVVQGALSLVLLVGSGLFVRSLRHVRDVRLGFDADSVLMVGLNMRNVKIDSAQTAMLRLRLLDAASTVPGIEHASLVVSEPFGGMSDWPIFVEGIDSTSKFGRFEHQVISPDYFATMGTRMLRGRGIESGDVHGATRAMVVGASMARVLWPDADPLGKCVRVGLVDTVPCTYVVGVAEDIHARGFGPQDRSFYYYLAAAQFRPHLGGLFVRAAGDVRRSIEPLRLRLQKEMPGASYVTVSRLAELVEEESRSWVMGATLFTAFGTLALILAAVGLYSVIAYNVAQRRQELAVRVALGAAAGNVVRLVVGQGLRFAVTGAVVGGAIAYFAAPKIAPLLFNQSPRDPVVFGAVIGALLVVAVVASMIPALRAARVDPNSVLRAE